MKVFVLALCLVMAVGDHDTTTEPDVFCRAVTIFFNQVNLNCQTLMQASLTVRCTHGQTLTRLIFFSIQSDPDAFCAGNCSQQLAQALHDCGDPSYADVISCKCHEYHRRFIRLQYYYYWSVLEPILCLSLYVVCAKDPVNLQFCGSVERNQTTISALNTSCSGSGNCSTECQTAVDEV